MRKLTKSERRLLIILGIAIFVVVNFYGLGYLLEVESSLAQQLSELRDKSRSNELWLREKDLWLARKTWIDASQPRISPNLVPQSALLESLTTSAHANNLEIQEQSFGETRNTPGYESVSVRLKVGGSLRNVLGWLVQIQQPELFQAVTNFSLKSENEPPSVSLDLEVARWYAPHV